MFFASPFVEPTQCYRNTLMVFQTRKKTKKAKKVVPCSWAVTAGAVTSRPSEEQMLNKSQAIDTH